MTRSIPSIIVLSLMCFTISYGLVRFPDAGILDAAPARIVVTDQSSDKQTSISMKQPTDGSELLLDEAPSSTALEEPQASSDELFVLDSTTPPAEEAVDAASNNSASENAAQKAPENKKKKSNKGGSKAKESKKPDTSVSIADATDKAEDAAATTESKEPELPKLESEPEIKSEDDSLTLIGIPDNDKSAQDGSLPIETDMDPFPLTDAMDSDVPPIVVDNNPPESVPEPLMADEQTAQDEFSIPGMTPETEESVNKFWEDRLNENATSNEASSSKDNFSTDTANSSPTEKQESKTSEPSVIKTDPNAQEIPPRNRETKPANQDALTLPALDEPQTVSPNANQSNTGTIPLESFPLDASATQKVNYTEVCQEEPCDTLGFDIPETGPIVVKRLPSVDNSVDPIYNNAQLDRFAL